LSHGISIRLQSHSFAGRGGFHYEDSEAIGAVYHCRGYDVRGNAKEPDTSTSREWIFKMGKVREIKQIGKDQLLHPAGPRIADDGNLCCHDFERHLK
jgi:hypothetical protein